MIDGLAEVARALDDDTELLRCLERRAEIGGDQTPVSVLLEAASLRSDRGEDAAAASLLERALRQAPDDALVVEALSDTLTRLGRCEDLVDLLERRAALAGSDASMRAAIFAELGALQEERLGDPEAAALAYQRAFAADPGAPGVVAALDRLLPQGRGLAVAAAAARASRRRRAGGAARRLRVRARRPAGGAAGAADRGGARLPERARARSPRGGRAPRAAPAGGRARRFRRAAADRRERSRRHQRPHAHRRARARAGGRLRGARPVRARARLGAALGRERPREPRAARRVRAAARRARPRRGAGDLPRATGAAAAGKRARFESTAAGPPPRRAGSRSRQHPSVSRRRSSRTRTTWSRWKRSPAQLERAGRIEELVRARRWLADAAPPERRAACLDALARLLAERVGDLAGAIEALTRLAASDGAPADAGARLEQLLEQTGRYDELAAHLLRSAPRPRGRQPRGAAARSAPRADPAGSARALRRGRRALSRGAGAAQRIPAKRATGWRRRCARRGIWRASPNGSRPARRTRPIRRPGPCWPSSRPRLLEQLPDRTGRRAAGARAGARVRPPGAALRHRPRAAGEPARADRRHRRAARAARGIALRRRAGRRRRAPRAARPALSRPALGRGRRGPPLRSRRAPAATGARKPGARSPSSTPRPGAAPSCSGRSRPSSPPDPIGSARSVCAAAPRRCSPTRRTAPSACAATGNASSSWTTRTSRRPIT